MNFDYLPHTQENKNKLFSRAPKWNDEAYISSVPFEVNIAYQRSPIPTEDFSYFDDKGNITKMTISEAKLYNKNGYYGKLKQWDEYNLFVIKIEE